MQHRRRKGGSVSLRLKVGRFLFAGIAIWGLIAAAPAAEGPSGITRRVALPAFREGAPRCQTPPGLTRTLAFAQDNDRDFIQGVGYGLQRAARDRQLEFRATLAANDPGLMIQQVQAFQADHVGALVTAPVDPVTLAPHLQALIWNGAYVGAVVPPPATTILNAPQYRTGKILGEAAVAYIRDKLKGRARVVLLTHDGLQFLAPRFTALRDAMKALPNVRIIADISPATVNKQGGFETMRTILLAHNDVDVVLGADTVVLGAMEALRAAGKLRPDQFLGGIDGEADAVAEIKRGGAYKVSVSLASSVFGYAMGQHAADWLEGKSIPQAMDILPRPLTLASLAQYEADVTDPASVFRSPERRQDYLRMYGNICYDTRDQYLNFPWSSEAGR